MIFALMQTFKQTRQQSFESMPPIQKLNFHQAPPQVPILLQQMHLDLQPVFWIGHSQTLILSFDLRDYLLWFGHQTLQSEFLLVTSYNLNLTTLRSLNLHASVSFLVPSPISSILVHLAEMCHEIEILSDSVRPSISGSEFCSYNL